MRGRPSLHPAKAQGPLRFVCLGASLLVIAMPAVASGASAEEHPRFGPILFALAVLVISAKVGGLLAERWRQPPVLGELLVGVALANLLPPFFGEAGIAFVRAEPTLRILAEVGVLLLLFDVGLEADLRAFARVGRSSCLVAVLGVVVPLGLGWGAARWALARSPGVVHLFIGATLSATSVGITARVLRDLGVSQSREGQIIIGAAILDDVLGLVVLAVVTSLVTTAATGEAGISGPAVAGIFLRAVFFLGLTVALGHFLSNPIVRLVARTGHPELMLVVGLGLCFTLAFAAELVGLVGIIGAFAAGLLLDPYGKGVRTREEDATLAELLHPLSSLLVPLFFVLMGMRMQLGSLANLTAMGFGGLLLLCALAGKLACALGVLEHGVNRLAVAIGMVPRGEVGLIFAGIGTSLTLGGQPLLSQSLFSAVVLMVLVPTLVAPVGLRWAFSRRRRLGVPGTEG
jgi:Kef-type K+ transport system membrane component KefB